MIISKNMVIIQKIKGIKEVVSRKEFLGVVFGFGLAGALWGWECYRGTVGSDDVITSPFSFILGAVFLGVFGGIALVLAGFGEARPRQIREVWLRQLLLVLRIVLLGTAGCMVGFVVPYFFTMVMFLDGGTISTAETILLYGGIIIWGIGRAITLPLEVIFSYFTEVDLISFWNLEPSLWVGFIWSEALVTGIIIALFYGLLLKTKLKSLMLRGGIGFSIAFLISPIIGNLIGNNLLNSLFSAYIITFALIGVIFGIALSSKLLEKHSP